MCNHLAFDFPMRPGFLAQVVVPRDMTRREAERLCAMIMTLPLPVAQNTSSEQSQVLGMESVQ